VSDSFGVHRIRATPFDDIDFTELIDPSVAHHQSADTLLCTRRPNGAGLYPFQFISHDASLAGVFEALDEANPREVASWGTRRLTQWLKRWNLPAHEGSSNWARAFFRETMRMWVSDPNSRHTSAASSAAAVDVAFGQFTFFATGDEFKTRDIDAVIMRLEREGRAHFRRLWGSGINSPSRRHLEWTAFSILGREKSFSIANRQKLRDDSGVRAQVRKVKTLLGL